MSVELILLRILLALQLGALVWSIAQCIRAHRTRQEIERMIGVLEEYEDDR